AARQRALSTRARGARGRGGSRGSGEAHRAVGGSGDRFSIDIAAIREHFPALERAHDGAPVAYFDAPGGTQVPREVVDAMTDYLFNHNANTHWSYPSSEETDAIITDAREALADFLNAKPSEIVFGQNMT